MPKKPFAPQIVSANDLLAGDVVYLDRTGTWTRHLVRAAVAMTPEEAEALLDTAVSQPAAVVGPYLVDVDLTPGEGPTPVHFRESFREQGPSNRPDLGRQADFSDAAVSDAALSGGGAW
ncbi:MAG: DUF2849 domain-containing protein [Pseudomonadota bacterium]